MSMNFVIDEDTSLYHHGIAGQKWGKRNGPPYPLDRTDSGQISKNKKKEIARKIVKGAIFTATMMPDLLIAASTGLPPMTIAEMASRKIFKLPQLTETELLENNPRLRRNVEKASKTNMTNIQEQNDRFFRDAQSMAVSSLLMGSQTAMNMHTSAINNAISIHNQMSHF